MPRLIFSYVFLFWFSPASCRPSSGPGCLWTDEVGEKLYLVGLLIERSWARDKQKSPEQMPNANRVAYGTRVRRSSAAEGGSGCGPQTHSRAYGSGLGWPPRGTSSEPPSHSFASVLLPSST